MTQKKDYIKVGMRYEVDRNWAFQGEPNPPYGYYFKHEEIYLNEPDEICFICQWAFNNNGLREDWMILQIDLTDKIDRLRFLTAKAFTHNSLLEFCKETLPQYPQLANSPEELCDKIFYDITGYETMYGWVNEMTGQTLLPELPRRHLL